MLVCDRNTNSARPSGQERRLTLLTLNLKRLFEELYLQGLAFTSTDLPELNQLRWSSCLSLWMWTRSHHTRHTLASSQEKRSLHREEDHCFIAAFKSTLLLFLLSAHPWENPNRKQQNADLQTPPNSLKRLFFCVDPQRWLIGKLNYE